MADANVMKHISDLVEEEHRLRAADGPDDTERLAAVERELDQCWDLLRQRRARRDAGADADGATARPEDTVEHYQQ